MFPADMLGEILQRFNTLRVLVIGDLYLDRYMFGQPARVSREAPIMVLEETRLEDRPGGGCAPALALARLGASVHQIGVTGADAEGEALQRLLQDQQIDTSSILTDATRPTTVKTRIVAEGAFNVFPQQVSRIDRQDRSPLSSGVEGSIIQEIERVAPAVDVIIISDYRSGVVTPAVIDAVRSTGRFATVDSQGALLDFRGLDLIKCNQAEAEQYLHQPLHSTDQRTTLLTDLQKRLATDRLIVTLGPDGAAISSTGTGYHEMPPLDQQQVFDVTGAGDTVIAILSAAIATGAEDLPALYLSQVAAGIVIARWGNAQADMSDLLAAIEHHAGDDEQQ
jgi:D-glycero-beta-D-manno-heptose-7-phosphate kinase